MSEREWVAEWLFGWSMRTTSNYVLRITERGWEEESVEAREEYFNGADAILRLLTRPQKQADRTCDTCGELFEVDPKTCVGCRAVALLPEPMGVGKTEFGGCLTDHRVPPELPPAIPGESSELGAAR